MARKVVVGARRAAPATVQAIGGDPVDHGDVQHRTGEHGGDDGEEHATPHRDPCSSCKALRDVHSSTPVLVPRTDRIGASYGIGRQRPRL